jgi:cobaltochelatase CobS
MSIELRCLACGYEGEALTEHFENGECVMSMEEYMKTFKNVKTETSEGPKKRTPVTKKPITMPPLAKGGMPHPDDEEIFKLKPEAFSIQKLFGVKVKQDRIWGFDKTTKHVPELDPNFVFPEEIFKLIYINHAYNKPLQITGPTGTGKTTVIEQVAARLNIPVMKVMHTIDITTHRIKGQNKVKGREVVYNDGPLPFAMARPFWILLDEWPAAAPEVAFNYFPFLEVKPTNTLGQILLEEDDNRKVFSHPNCRVFGTGNTSGFMDETGFYQGNQVQNLALINRWLLKAKLGYLDQGTESDILKSKYPDLEDLEVRHMVKVANKVRESYANGRIQVPFSVRDILNWADLYMMVGDPIYAMKVTLTNALSFQDSGTIEEIVQRAFGGS